MSTTSEQKLIVHHLNDSRSQRVLWLFEELELPYEIKKYTRLPTHQAPKELFDVNPLGKAPVITDNGLNIAESGAIVEYVIEKYGNGKALVPEAGKLDNLYYTHYAEGTLMPLLVNKLIFSLVPGHAPFFIRPLVRLIFSQLDETLVVPQLKTNLAMIEAHLAKVKAATPDAATKGFFFAGGTEPTCADYMMQFPLEAMVSRAPAGDLVKEYVTLNQARPAYKRGLEKGGEYSYAKSA